MAAAPSFQHQASLVAAWAKLAQARCTPEVLQAALAPESKASVPWFLDFAALGLLPIGSQEGNQARGKQASSSLLLAQAIEAARLSKKEGDNFPKIVDAEFAKLGGTYGAEGLTLSERAFVQGFMPFTQAQVFLHFINLTNKIGTECGGRLPLTYQYMNTVSAGSVYALMPRELPATTSIPVACHSGACDCLDHNLESLPLTKDDRPEQYDLVHVTAVDPEHGRRAASADGLYPAVKKALQQTHSVFALHAAPAPAEAVPPAAAVVAPAAAPAASD